MKIDQLPDWLSVSMPALIVEGTPYKEEIGVEYKIKIKISDSFLHIFDEFRVLMLNQGLIKNPNLPTL